MFSSFLRGAIRLKSPRRFFKDQSEKAPRQISVEAFELFSGGLALFYVEQFALNRHALVEGAEYSDAGRESIRKWLWLGDELVG
jgi:hypothetical protein